MSNIGQQITLYAASDEEMESDSNESLEIQSEEEEETPDLAEVLTRPHTKTKVFSGSKARSITTAYREACSKKMEKTWTKDEHDWRVRCGRDFNVRKKCHREKWIEVYARLEEEKNSKLQPIINEIRERAELKKHELKKVKVLATLPVGPSKKKPKLSTPVSEEILEKVGSLKQKDQRQRQNDGKMEPKPKPKRGPAPLMKKSIKAARAMQMRYRR